MKKVLLLDIDVLHAVPIVLVPVVALFPWPCELIGVFSLPQHSSLSDAVVVPLRPLTYTCIPTQDMAASV